MTQWWRTRRARFEALVSPHLDHLYRLALRWTGRPEAAEDLVHDVLVKLLPRTDELAAVDRLRPWLARVLYRQFVDDRRRGGASDTANGPDVDTLVDNNPGPEAAAVQSIHRRLLVDALQRLPEAHRVVLVLHDVEGYTLEELTTVLDAPLGTLKSRLHRARHALRRQLGMEPSGT